MAAGNTQFKVENGLYIVGNSNAYGSMRVEGDLSVGGNLAFASLAAGDIKPGAAGATLGNTTARWAVFATTGDFNANVSMTDTVTVNNAIASNLVASANNSALGSSTRRWDLYANNANLITASVSNTLAVTGAVTFSNTLAVTGNTTLSNTLTLGAIVANTTALTISNGALSVNTGSKLAIWTSGNSTYSNLALNNDVSNIFGNVTFDTDLLVLDAVNNLIGIKNTTPSSAAVVTVTGNVQFSTANTGLRLNTANASINAYIMMVANTTNSRVTFATYDNSNASIQDGGFNFNGTNSSSTQTLLSFNGYNFQYKSGNVAHSGNFGIYNVSGTRVGP